MGLFHCRVPAGETFPCGWVPAGDFPMWLSSCRCNFSYVASDDSAFVSFDWLIFMIKTVLFHHQNCSSVGKMICNSISDADLIIFAAKLAINGQYMTKNSMQTPQKLCSSCSNFPLYKPHSRFGFGKLRWLSKQYICEIQNANFREHIEIAHGWVTYVALSIQWKDMRWRYIYISPIAC